MQTTAALASESLLRGLRAALTGLFWMCWAAIAVAHPMPETRVWIDTTPDGLRLTLQLPLNRLEYGYGQPLADQPGKVLPQHAEALSRYLLQHLHARSGAQEWRVSPPQLSVEGTDATADLHAVMTLQAPAGADPRSLTLLYDVITHEVRTHRVQVFLRNDWAAGFVGEAPLLLGEMDHQRASLLVSLPQQTETGASFKRLMKAGAQHIAEGTDHLLFLLVLLIVAPLSVRARRWSEPRPVRAAILQLAAVVTAFTIGHSVTLALGSLGWVKAPAQPVEVAVAASILIAAMHALRPLLRHGEVRMAAAFGMVHGLAFSASLSGAGLTAWQHAQALFAFNLGIEAMQLAVLVVAMPPLLVIASCLPTVYTRIRQLGALAASFMACFWICERLGFTLGALSSWTDAAAHQAPALAGALWCGAAIALWLRTGKSTRPGVTPYSRGRK